MNQYYPQIMTKTIGIYKTLYVPKNSFAEIKKFFIDNNYITANTKILAYNFMNRIIKISLHDYFGENWENKIQNLTTDQWYDIFSGKYWYKKGWDEE